MGMCGFLARWTPRRRTWNAGFLTIFYVNRAVFFVLENSLHIFAVWFMEE